MDGSESGYLEVLVETRTIQAGGELTGVIHFLLHSAIKAESLGLEFSGEEYCHWQKFGLGDQVTNFVGKTPTVKQLYPIFTFPDPHVAAGNYHFPFSVTIPTTLPGSFNYQTGSTTAQISYSASAYLHPANPKIRNFNIEVRVTRRRTKAIVSLQDRVSAQVSSWCFLHKGEVRLGVVINKSAYEPGELCHLSVQVDNSRCLLDVVRLKATLYRTFRLTDNYRQTTVLKQSISEEYATQRIPAGRSLSDPLGIALPVQDSTGSVSTTPHLQGTHIVCVYTVAVRAEMAGCCKCGRVPELTRVVIVYPRQRPLEERPQAPVDWSPVVLPQYKQA